MTTKQVSTSICENTHAHIAGHTYVYKFIDVLNICTKIILAFDISEVRKYEITEIFA